LRQGNPDNGASFGGDEQVDNEGEEAMGVREEKENNETSTESPDVDASNE
jgi:hypothetical protein